MLDQATSSLDAESEEAVQAAVEKLMAGRTTFVIAHRLATVLKASCITVLREGRVVEIAPHTALMRRERYCASLARRQSRQLIANDSDARDAGRELS